MLDLRAVPLQKLLQVARAHGLVPCYGKYSRASFLYPDLQPEEYKSFDSELGHLRAHLGHIGNGGSAFVLGDKFHGLQWHLFVITEDTAALKPSAVPQAATGAASMPLHTMEVCMTDLEPAAAQQFVRTESFVSSKHTTITTGIRALMPHGDLDDYVFEPCGCAPNFSGLPVPCEVNFMAGSLCVHTVLVFTNWFCVLPNRACRLTAVTCLLILVDVATGTP